MHENKTILEAIDEFGEGVQKDIAKNEQRKKEQQHKKRLRIEIVASALLIIVGIVLIALYASIQNQPSIIRHWESTTSSQEAAGQVGTRTTYADFYANGTGSIVLDGNETSCTWTTYAQSDFYEHQTDYYTITCEDGTTWVFSVMDYYGDGSFNGFLTRNNTVSYSFHGSR